MRNHPIVQQVVHYAPLIAAIALLVWGIFVAWNLPFGQQPASLPAAAATPNQGAEPVAPPIIPPDAPTLYPYIEITEGCGPNYNGPCVNLRSGPGEEYSVVMPLRIGIVLKVAETVVSNGREWYKIALDDELHFPERVTSDWYVAADVAHLIHDDGDHRIIDDEIATTSKRILVDRSTEMLYAYEGDTLFMQSRISTGLEFTPTPIGTFRVYKMTPSRYMQGPIENVSDQFFDLPGVPWNLYFTSDGAVIHGAYWHDKFGQPWSHGCVNLPIEKAKELYLWADLGTTVTVHD